MLTRQNSESNWRSTLERVFGAAALVEPASDLLADHRVVLEEKISHRIPDSLAALLEIIAKSPELARGLGEFRWLAFEEIGEIWRVHAMLSESDEIVAPDLASVWDKRILRMAYHRDRIPIAEFNGDVYILLDFAPTEWGIEGQVVQIDPEGLCWMWISTSFDDLLLDISRGRILDPDFESEE